MITSNSFNGYTAIMLKSSIAMELKRLSSSKVSKKLKIHSPKQLWVI